MLFFTLLTNLLFFIPQSSAEIIDGYPGQMSAFPGDSVALYLNASEEAEQYSLNLYDLDGEVVATFTLPVFPQTPAKEKPYENGYGYKLTKKVKTPTLPSGLYLWDNKIPFIIKTKKAKIVIVYPSNTVNAYCNSGDKSLYGFNSTEKTGAQKVSFLRPQPMPQYSEAFLRWIQKENIKDIGYVTDIDLEDYKTIKKSELIIIPGHSEYWTLQARKNFDRFVADGKDAMILSGNTMWWQVRYNKTCDQLICYKNADDDPIKKEKLKTITWRQPALNYPIIKSTGTDFENAGYGLKTDQGWDGFKIVSNSPLLEGTDLSIGDIVSCPSHELDGVPLLSVRNDTLLIDYEALQFQKVEIVGYDRVWRVKEGFATWIVFKASRSSGIVINTASTDWCSSRGIGSNRDIEEITRTMIQKLMNDENVFSVDVPAGNPVAMDKTIGHNQ